MSIENENEQLRRSYALAFGSPAGQQVLADLAPFCRAAQSCFDADPRIHAVLEGRREVWLRIQNFMRLTDEEILQLALRRPRIVNANEERNDG